MSKVLALSFLLAVAWIPALADSRPTIAPNGIVNSVFPDAAAATLGATGLSTDQNIATWRIEYHFTGFAIQ